MNYVRKTILLILIATLVRFVIAGTTGLGNDEAYYRMFSSHLQWNYFDHPPMVAWLIRLTTLNLLLDTELFIRLGAIICAAMATWFIFLTGKRLGNERTGFFAASIYTATLYGSIIAGTFILPDSPQMVCWTASIYLLTGVTASVQLRNSMKRELLVFGIVAGLGMLCKVHTIFLWLGFLLFVILYNRRWLKEPVLYLSGAITILFFYPVIRWNIDNHFVTFFYHGGRVNIAEGGLDLASFGQFFGGQIFYLNPVIFVCIIIAVVHAFKNDLPVSIPHKRILLLTSLPLIIIATIISFFRNVLPHWSGPGYTGLILLTACYFTSRKKTGTFEKKLFPLPVIIAHGLQLLIIIAGLMAIQFFPGTIGNKDRQKLGEGDFTLDMFGWNDFARSFEQIYTANKSMENHSDRTVVLSNKWFPLAHIEHYVAGPLRLPVFASGSLEDIHQYKWINEEQGGMQDSVSVYVIIPSNYYFDIKEFPILKEKVPAAIFTIPQKRNGEDARVFKVYYFKKDKYDLHK